jgi:hypothetical protein
MFETHNLDVLQSIPFLPVPIPGRCRSSVAARLFSQARRQARVNTGEAECANQGSGIGLAGLCTSGWRIRYLAPSPISEDTAPKSEPTAMNEPFQIHRSAGNRPVARTYFDPVRPATARRCLTRDATAGRIIG